VPGNGALARGRADRRAVWVAGAHRKNVTAFAASDAVNPWALSPKASQFSVNGESLSIHVG
jgi:hypothetical protein